MAAKIRETPAKVKAPETQPKELSKQVRITTRATLIDPQNISISWQSFA